MDRASWLRREATAKTVWVLFYVGAIEGTTRWLRPSHVYRMTERQAGRLGGRDRSLYSSSGRALVGKRWYADNSREQIRDETLRGGLLPLGAVIERAGLNPTSSKPRWALGKSFASLFLLSDREAPAAIALWQKSHLSAAALARVTLARQGLTRAAADTHVTVTMPDGSSRHLPAGDSSVIAKGVVEEFLPRFCEQPVVIWMSDSRQHVVQADDRLARQLRLDITNHGILPDLIAVDVRAASPTPLFIFIEIVASEGPVDQTRKAALLHLLESGGYDAAHGRFVTAFHDRGAAAFRRTVGQLAWGSEAWFMTEPDGLLVMFARPAIGLVP